MKKIELSAFVLLMIGTLGLLMNELVFTWGRPATLFFAVINVSGLVALGLSYWRSKQDK